MRKGPVEQKFPWNDPEKSCSAGFQVHWLAFGQTLDKLLVNGNLWSKDKVVAVLKNHAAGQERWSLRINAVSPKVKFSANQVEKSNILENVSVSANSLFSLAKTSRRYDRMPN